MINRKKNHFNFCSLFSRERQIIFSFSIQSQLWKISGDNDLWPSLCKYHNIETCSAAIDVSPIEVLPLYRKRGTLISDNIVTSDGGSVGIQRRICRQARIWRKTHPPGDLASRKGTEKDEPKNLENALGWNLGGREEADGGRRRERTSSSSPPSVLVTRKTSKQARMGDNGWWIFHTRKAEAPAAPVNDRPRRQSSYNNHPYLWTRRRRRSCCIRTPMSDDARKTCGSC